MPLVQQSVELLSKGWVLLLAAIYGSGYLVVSIYHASLGLNAINLLRPQIAAAGLLFVALTSMAVFLLRYMRSVVGRLDPSISPLRSYFFSTCFGGFYLFCFDCMATIPIQPILHFEGPQPHQGVFILIVAAGVLGLSAILASGERQRIAMGISLGSATVFRPRDTFAPTDVLSVPPSVWPSSICRLPISCSSLFGRNLQTSRHPR
jgi:hypothetical protein